MSRPPKPLWVLVSGDFTPLGGMDRANHALASYLARVAGADVRLVTHRAWPDLAALPGVDVRAVPRPWGKHALGEGLLRRAGRREGRRAAAEGGRVVVNGGNCDHGDVNWVHYLHDAWAPKGGGGGPARRVKETLYHRISVRSERASLRKARVVVANSERTRSTLLERFGLDPARVHTVYYGTDPDAFRPPTAPERAEARDRLGWGDDRPTLAFVGALGDRRKGLDTLLDAWRRLARDAGWDGRLAVVGAGPALGRLKAGARDLGGSVEFLGFRRDVPLILRGADALASPTRYEAYGLNVHEALCCGLPAIVSAAAGVAERFPEGLRPLLLPDPDDDADLAARVRRWREGRGAFASAALGASAALRSHTWDDMAARFVAAAGGP